MTCDGYWSMQTLTKFIPLFYAYGWDVSQGSCENNATTEIYMYKRKANWVKISNFKTVIKDSAVINAVLSFDRLEKNARKSIIFYHCCTLLWGMWVYRKNPNSWVEKNDKIA